MLKISLGFVLFFVLITQVSCKRFQPSEECQATADISLPNRIMPLGASRVEGGRSGDEVQYESYRYELWKRLVNANYDFDFIGTYCDLGNYEPYSGQSFDINHQGIGGITSTDLLAGLPDYLNMVGPPDYVLLSSPGGNDALNGEPFEVAAENVRDMILLLQASNSSCTVLIEQMAPAMSAEMTSELASFMDQMNQEVLSLSQELSTSSSKIIVVDMKTGFSDDYLSDEVHYNTLGAEFIANKYFEVLDTLLE